MERHRNLIRIALAVTVIVSTVAIWHFVVEARQRDYVANDLPVYRESFFTWTNRSFLQYDAMAIPGTERAFRDPVSGKTKTIYVYRITPGPETQARLDKLNGRLAATSRRLGDRFSDEALGRREDELRFRKYFGGDRAAIAEYRQKLNDLDGVIRKLTLGDLTCDPTLVALARAYTL